MQGKKTPGRGHSNIESHMRLPDELSILNHQDLVVGERRDGRRDGEKEGTSFAQQLCGTNILLKRERERHESGK